MSRKFFHDRRPVAQAISQQGKWVCRLCGRTRSLHDRCCPVCGAAGMVKMAATAALHLQALPPAPPVPAGRRCNV